MIVVLKKNYLCICIAYDRRIIIYACMIIIINIINGTFSHITYYNHKKFLYNNIHATCYILKHLYF